MSIIPVRTLWRMTWQDRLTLAEAIVWLAIAGLIIAVVPFRNFGFLAALPVRKLPPAHEARNLMRRQIRWAIVTAARRVPWRALCIQQGLAANLCFGDEAYRPCCTTALRCARGISKPMSGFATATLMSSEERPLRGMRCLLDFRLSAKLH